MSQFAIATFCFSERYQNQVNRLISEIDTCEFKPTVVVVTDNVDNILDKPFVKKYDISQFNPEYKNFANTYYDFDFSVKRYSLLAALNLGYNKVILTDADAVPNKNLFNEDHIMKGFVTNSIQGQVTYNFSNEIITNSQLGERFLEYEKYFNVSYDKNNLNFMPEDCIQFIDIETNKFYNFLRIWDECIKYKKSNRLSNVPAGNIDEMCFSALQNGLSVGNNSDKVMNALTPIHDKWYMSGQNEDTDIKVYEDINLDNKKEIKKNKIVTGVYELFYNQSRGSGQYKGFDLLTVTIRNIIFDDFEYVIYTDIKTYNKYNLNKLFDKPNITIKFKELNSNYYSEVLDPIRQERISMGDIWDRIYSVDNYIEVIYNKLECVIDESVNYDGNVVWVDSGFFGTSCSNGWRDYINEICHTNNFVSKVFEKTNKYGFISLLGNLILINYELKDKINSVFGTSPKVIPGALFGGDSKKNIEYLSEYKSFINRFIESSNNYTSEQELLYLLLHDKEVKFFEFGDWDDLQKGILQIMDSYDESIYVNHNCLSYKKPNMNIKDYTNKSFTEIADMIGIDKGSLHENHMYTIIYEEYLTKFKSETPVIVEIGVTDTRFPGGCLEFWDSIFSKMEYYGYDIIDCSNFNYNKDKISLFMGDQNNENDLKEFIYKFDLPDRVDFIIDDGSHVSEHIITSFKTLYPFLKDGGYYFIEDLHAGWAERDKTIEEINSIIINNNFKVSEKVLKNNNKLLIITK